jgi:hypothetical protein
MAVYSVETNSYSEACVLIKKLQVIGAECYLSCGCVAVQCKPDQLNLVQEICSNSNATFRSGYIGTQQDVLLKSSDGAVLAKKIQGDAQAIIQEWKE